MPKAYWVGAHMTVKDPEKLNAYAKLAAQASAKHGGVVLREKGMDLEDLVETRTYMINKDDLPGYRAGRARVFGTGE